MSIEIRQAAPNDVEHLAQLFKETIENINAKDYSPEQISVWSKGSTKKERLLKKIEKQYFLVAEKSSTIVGFGSITQNGYLDFMYVSKDHQRKGVAQKIYDALEIFARTNCFDQIVSDVSITARPFFRRQGFEVVKEQQVDIEGIKLTNYKMQKHLSLR
jgi:putative acetyltransferase